MENPNESDVPSGLDRPSSEEQLLSGAGTASQALEPDYRLPGEVGLDADARELLNEERSEGSEETARQSASDAAGSLAGPVVARVGEAGPTSAPARMPSGSGGMRMEVDDVELIPDYSQLPEHPAVPSSWTGRVAPSHEATGCGSGPLDSLSGMLQGLLAEQLAPVIQNQRLLAERLERIESSRGSMSQDSVRAEPRLTAAPPGIFPSDAGLGSGVMGACGGAMGFGTAASGFEGGLSAEMVAELNRQQFLTQSNPIGSTGRADVGAVGKLCLQDLWKPKLTEAKAGVWLRGKVVQARVRYGDRLSMEVSERAEDVRVSVSELPKLEIKEHERDLAPLLSGDWLAMISPAMKDISSTSSIWWSQVVDAATSYYQHWLMCDPVARLSLQPPQPYRFEHTKYARVEQRALTMLLRAVPTVIKEELVANRKLSCIELLALIHTTYQPGGLKERSALLRYLTNPDGCTEPVAALRSIKRWSRWKHRAAELHISTPDPTLLLGGVDMMVSKAFALYPESQFRISSYRFAKSIDHQPTEAKVVELVRFVQGELETLVASGTVRSKTKPDGDADAGKRLRIAKVEDNDAKGKGKSRDEASKGAEGKGKEICKHWRTDKGCRFAKACKYAHDPLLPSEKRCFACSALNHMRSECPYQSKDGRASENQKGKGKGSETIAKASAQASAPASYNNPLPTPQSSSQTPATESEDILKKAAAMIETLQTSIKTVSDGYGGVAVPAVIQAGCPRVTRSVALSLIDFIEKTSLEVPRDLVDSTSWLVPPEGEDLLNPAVYSYILSLALSGRLVAVLSGQGMVRADGEFLNFRRYFLAANLSVPFDVHVAGSEKPVADKPDEPAPSASEEPAEWEQAGDYEDPDADHKQVGELLPEEGVDEDNYLSKVQIVNIPFGIPLKNKGAQEVLRALKLIDARASCLGIKIARLHSDKGSEFDNRFVRDWAASRGIWKSSTGGDNWRSNGTAEALVGILK
ncbi:GIP, partial [Symbiodinium microadriaticum]